MIRVTTNFHDIFRKTISWSSILKEGDIFGKKALAIAK